MRLWRKVHNAGYTLASEAMHSVISYCSDCTKQNHHICRHVPQDIHVKQTLTLTKSTTLNFCAEHYHVLHLPCSVAGVFCLSGLQLLCGSVAARGHGMFYRRSQKQVKCKHDLHALGWGRECGGDVTDVIQPIARAFPRATYKQAQDE